jgi:hypothetical protein
VDMAVSPSVRELSFGMAQGKATLGKAGFFGAHVIYLETTDQLTPAIALHERLGFHHVKGIDSPYERCNVQMAVQLK